MVSVASDHRTGKDMDLVTRIVVIGFTGLFMGTTMAATVRSAMPLKAVLAGTVALAVWILLGRMMVPRPNPQQKGVPTDVENPEQPGRGD
jgi:hypothetical protein